MFLIHSLVAFLAIYGHSFSVSAHELVNQGQFTLQQTVIQHHSKNPGIEAIRSTYIKYGLQPPPLRDLVSMAEPSAQGSTAASPGWNDRWYTIKAQVGKQTLNLDLDTGSSDL